MDLDQARSGELAASFVHDNAVCFQQTRHTTDQSAYDAVLAIHQGLPVDLDRVADKADAVAVFYGMIQFGSMQQRLGRDAADVETGAAEVFLFHQVGLGT